MQKLVQKAKPIKLKNNEDEKAEDQPQSTAEVSEK
jgi:hypothetical protein